MSAEIIVHNARIATNAVPSFVEAIAVSDGKVTAIGGNEEILRLRGPATRVIDGRRRTVIPGLNDSHMHPIRGGLNYNLELRWDGVPSLADALRMLKEQAARTPAPQWVRVIGGWTEFQFAERRMPTLEEINAAAPETPVFVMHLYDRALLNGAALRALGYDKMPRNFQPVKCNATVTGIPQVFSSRSPTQIFSTPPWRRDRNCRAKTSSTLPGSFSASSTALELPV